MNYEQFSPLDIDIFPEYETKWAETPLPPKNTNTDPSKAPVSWDWFEEEGLPVFDWVVNKLGICPGPITILSGFSNVGKTFFAANLSICVANAFPIFRTIPVENPGKVLHIDWDQGQKFSRIYYWRMLNGYDLKSFNGIDYMKPEWHLHDKDVKDNMVKLLSGYKMCVIDCLGSAIPQADINDDRVRAYIDMLNEISEKSHCAIVLLHHEPKASNNGTDVLRKIKGNGSIISAAGCSIHLTAQKNKTIKYELGKKRLIKDIEGFYILQDIGEMSEKLGIEKGIKLTVVEGETEVDPKEQLLEIIIANPGIESTPLKQKMSGRNEDKVALIALVISEGLVRTEGKKPCKHYIVNE